MGTGKSGGAQEIALGEDRVELRVREGKVRGRARGETGGVKERGSDGGYQSERGAGARRGAQAT
jgi:hypothetical protein